MNLLENLGIHQDLVTKDRVELSMPVQAKHLQPYGIVHGGINTVLAETAASLGANANVAPGRIAVRGQCYHTTYPCDTGRGDFCGCDPLITLVTHFRPGKPGCWLTTD